MRWAIVAIVGMASAGMLAVSAAMNFAFGSSFGRTAFESYAYGAAFGLADILKVVAPIIVANSLRKRMFGSAAVGLLLWGTFTLCSAISAVGFASANRTFTVDARTVQAALNQSRLASLEADQAELRRLRDRLALPELGRSERLQVASAAQRLEAAIATNRGKLEDAAPVVSTPNPQAHTFASLTGASINRVETGLVLLVALLVEMGGLGPFVTMSLAKTTKVPASPEPGRQAAPTAAGETGSFGPPTGSLDSATQRPRLIYSAAEPESLESDLGRFLNLHARQGDEFTLGSTDLLARYNGSRRKRGLPIITHRRFGDTMCALGYRRKLRLSGGHVHYQGLAWVEQGLGRLAA